MKGFGSEIGTELSRIFGAMALRNIAPAPSLLSIESTILYYAN